MAIKTYPCCDSAECPICYGTGIVEEVSDIDLANLVSHKLDCGDMNSENNRTLVRQLVNEFTALLYKEKRP